MNLVPPVDRTLWGVPPVFTQVQVAVPLTARVSTAGLLVPFLRLVKKMLPTVMPIVLGGGGGGGAPVAVAVKVAGEPVALNGGLGRLRAAGRP